MRKSITKVSAPYHLRVAKGRPSLGEGTESRPATAGASGIANFALTSIAATLSCSRSVNMLMCGLLILALFFMYLAEDSIAHSNSHLDGSLHVNSHDYDGHTALYKSILGSIHSFSNRLTLIFLALRGRTTHPAYSYGDTGGAIMASIASPGVNTYPHPANYDQQSLMHSIQTYPGKESKPIESASLNLDPKSSTQLAQIAPLARLSLPLQPPSFQLSMKENVLAKKKQNKPILKGSKKVEGGTTFVLHKRTQKASDWVSSSSRIV